MPEEVEGELAREISRLNGDTTVKGTTSERIRLAAQVVVDAQHLMREDMNAAGAYVVPLAGRVTRTSHDPRRMQKAGFDAWRASIEPKLAAATWERAAIDPTDAAAREQFLRNVYGNLVTGNHHVQGRGDFDPLAGGFKAPGSLGRALSEDRVLHFQSADDWMAYNRQFGRGNLMESIIGDAESTARSVGLMQVWGPNPEDAFHRDVQKLADKLRDDGEFDASKKLRSSADAGSLHNQWAVINGEADRPGWDTVATVAANTRAVVGMASLGGQVLMNGSDLANIAATLRYEGIPIWKTIDNQTRALMPGYTTATRAEIARRVNAGLNATLGGLYHRLGYEPNLTGRMSQAANIYFKLNLQTYWQDAQERGIASLLASHIGESLSKDWAAIEGATRTGLQRFGVTEDDWNAMRAAQMLKDGDGTSYFTPDMVKGDARRRMAAWFSATMDSALTVPGVYEKALMTQGTRPGTILGEALRLVTQFKSYSLTSVTRHLGREMYRGDMPNFAGIAGLIASTSVLGYAGYTLRQYMYGKNPPLPETASDWVKVVGQAMAAGGGLGIYGDFLWGDYNRFGGGLAATLVGPTLGKASDLAGLFAATRDLDGEHLPAKAVGVLSRDFNPFNVVYAKTIFDHMIWYRLMELANPGSTRRMERRVQTQNHQTYWWHPSGGVEWPKLPGQ